jgi:ribosomal protein L5
MERQELIKKIEDLSPDRLAEIEKVVDSTTRVEHASDKERLHQALADYANKHAGTEADRDLALEAGLWSSS